MIPGGKEAFTAFFYCFSGWENKYYLAEVDRITYEPAAAGRKYKQLVMFRRGSQPNKIRPERGKQNMEKIIIVGGQPLNGSVRIGAAKNAILPIIAASLLAEGESTLEEITVLEDVNTICAVLRALGADVTIMEGSKIRVRAGGIAQPEAPYDLVRKMRASFLVMGPLLARLGRARISLPGGCAIGTRPIDLHLKGFTAMGARIIIGHGYIEAWAEKKLQGAKIYLDFPSVGATENIMMAAVLAAGTTVLENAAEEPEIVDLANYLNAMGARIKGAGTNVIKIEGVSGLRGTRYTVVPDRIEAGTYMVAAAMTGGKVRLLNIVPDHIKPVIAKLREIGVQVTEEGSAVHVEGQGQLNAVDVKTLPYPGFPTDMQAQIMALLTLARGTSVVTETVFENRFLHVDELKRMGADIRIEGRSAVVRGVNSLTGAPVRATDLRAGAALVIAGLAAEGETEVTGVHHLDRGYADIIGKLSRLGARVRRIKD
jgi:UDP-N-acetylglucosamine 1-carboxyvinyltransferase